jgi:hypothetical protein
VYESDTGVENGTYTYWGQEHCLGQHGQSASSTAGQVANNNDGSTGIVNGVENWLSANAGNATGNFSTNPGNSSSVTAGQSYLIGAGSMNVSRTADYGFPTE